jgi:transcriptional regulator
MYTPPQFEQPDIEIQHELIRNNPLATLITLNPDGGINANHIPLHLSATSEQFGILRGHVARANPIWQNLTTDKESLAIFHGAEAYISPSWYATKKETGKVVPTWNYEVVHAYGSLQVIDNAEWIRTQLEALTQHNEATHPNPWAVSDAPEDFTKNLIEAIVGIELVITRLVGKWKVSQNQPLQNRNSVIAGLNSNGKTEMAKLVESWQKS